MRRMMLIGLLLAAVGLAIPGAADAKRAGAARHHGAHHACKRKHHCSRARLLRFGTPAKAGTTGTTPSTQTPAPVAPTSPPVTPTNEDAGTVASFTGGVLTINLTGGGSVSGKVTEATELSCETLGSDDQGEGDDEHGGAPNGDSSIRADQIGPGPGDQGQEGDDDQGEGDDGQAGCTTEALKEGAIVREAELEIGSGGAVWERIELGA